VEIELLNRLWLVLDGHLAQPLLMLLVLLRLLVARNCTTVNQSRAVRKSGSPVFAWYYTGSVFLNLTSCENGGAACWEQNTSDSSEVRFEHCFFDGCQSNRTGGAFYHSGVPKASIPGHKGEIVYCCVRMCHARLAGQFLFVGLLRELMLNSTCFYMCPFWEGMYGFECNYCQTGALDMISSSNGTSINLNFTRCYTQSYGCVFYLRGGDMSNGISFLNVNDSWSSSMIYSNVTSVAVIRFSNFLTCYHQDNRY
jgi:hypothetical protein